MPARRPDNPYQYLVGITIEGQAPDHYELLGFHRFTDDPVAIKKASLERNSRLKTWDNSDYHLWSNELLDEGIAAIQGAGVSIRQG